MDYSPIPGRLRQRRDHGHEPDELAALLTEAANLIEVYEDRLERAGGEIEDRQSTIETLRAQLALIQGTDCVSTAVSPAPTPADLEAICVYVREHAKTVLSNIHPLDADKLHAVARVLHPT